MSNSNDNSTNNNGYEKKDINPKKIFLTLSISVLFVIVTVIFIIDYYGQLKQKVYYEQVLKPQSEALIKLHEREEDELHSYKLIDSASGIYRIPIDSAIKYMVENSPKEK
ncbi:MAG: hypothetical protein ABIJ45_07910 [Candidatus Zixiibacteriota bacterium]